MTQIHQKVQSGITIGIVNSDKLCAWRHKMPPLPASLNVISCKCENRQRLQVTAEFAKTQTTTTRKISSVLFYQVCADTAKAKQSTAEYGRRLWLFFAHQTSWPLTSWPWKWFPSHAWRGLPLSQF